MIQQGDGDMIVFYDSRCWATYARTNRRVRWNYAQWCGRWDTVEEAISVVRERFPGERVEYRIHNLTTDETLTGYVYGHEDRKEEV